LYCQLLKYKQQLQKLKPGAAKKQVEQRAMQVLKQKRMYEKQRDSVQGQVFNIDQAKFAQASLKDSVDMVAAMRETHTALKEQMGEFSVDDVDALHDDMEDMMLDSEEMNEILGRSYAIPDNIDEEELAAELSALDDELASELESESSVPAYLAPAVAQPAAISTSSSSILNELPVVSGPVQGGASRAPVEPVASAPAMPKASEVLRR
jgi:charged multivesicular body protein 5